MRTASSAVRFQVLLSGSSQPVIRRAAGGSSSAAGDLDAALGPDRLGPGRGRVLVEPPDDAFGVRLGRRGGRAARGAAVPGLAARAAAVAGAHAKAAAAQAEG